MALERLNYIFKNVPICQKEIFSMAVLRISIVEYSKGFKLKLKHLYGKPAINSKPQIISQSVSLSSINSSTYPSSVYIVCL